jgi:hypothetical protein
MFFFIVDDPSIDPILRHGRSSALFVALKESPDTVFSSVYSDKVIKTILCHLQADKVINILILLYINILIKYVYIFRFLL